MSATRKLVLIIVSQLIFFAAGCSLPLISEREIEMESENAYDDMRANTMVSTDFRTINYVVCVSEAIIDVIDEPYSSMDWDITVFDDEQVNAFAMAGGKIGIYTGLLKVTKNQDQLAAVIGHEVAHVTQRHTYERVNRNATTQIGAAAAGAALGGGYAGDAVQWGAQLGITLPFSRGEESEADTVGLLYMASAGFDPRQSISLWKEMDKASTSNPPELFSSHPSHDSRIDDLIGQLPAALGKYNEADSAGKSPRCEP
jgi:predicted Zn-dependent protease